MARRVYISAGAFRVSLPGFDAATAAAENLAFWEGQDTIQPLAAGQVTIANGGDIIIPYDGTLPLFYVWSLTPSVGVVAARRDNTHLRVNFYPMPYSPIDNGFSNVTATVFYAVYKNGVPID
jgi:hypothetical protein